MKFKERKQPQRSRRVSFYSRSVFTREGRKIAVFECTHKNQVRFMGLWYTLRAAGVFLGGAVLILLMPFIPNYMFYVWALMGVPIGLYLWFIHISWNKEYPQQVYPPLPDEDMPNEFANHWTRWEIMFAFFGAMWGNFIVKNTLDANKD